MKPKRGLVCMEQMILRLCPTSYLSVARNVSIYDPVTIPTLYYTISYIHNVVREMKMEQYHTESHCIFLRAFF